MVASFILAATLSVGWYWMGDCLQVGMPPRYVTSHPRPTQPPTLCGTGNEYRPKCDDALRLLVKAGWLILFVGKCVGGR